MWFTQIHKTGTFWYLQVQIFTLCWILSCDGPAEPHSSAGAEGEHRFWVKPPQRQVRGAGTKTLMFKLGNFQVIFGKRSKN